MINLMLLMGLNLNLKLRGIILECFYLTMTENKLWVMVYQLIYICKAAVDCLRILCILLPGPHICNGTFSFSRVGNPVRRW